VEACVKKGIIVVLFLLLLFSLAGELFSAPGDAFFTADATFNAKQYQQAKELYRGVFLNSKEGPEAARALLGIAKADYHLKNYYESGINLKRFFKSYPTSPFADEAHLIWGLDLLNIQRYKEAEEQLDSVKGSLRDRADVAKSELALIRGETEKAEQILSKIDRKMYEENNRVLYLRAMILSRQGKHELAIQTINRISDQALKEENIAVSKAIIYYNARKYIDAKDMLSAIVKNPSSRMEAIQAKRTLFQINDVENNQDEALKLAIDLMNFESTDELKMKIVAIFEKKGDLDSAFRYLTYLRDKKTLSEEIEKRLKKLIEEKNPKANEYVMKYFIYLSPDSPYTMELSKYFEEKGSKDQAKRLLQKAIRGKNGAEASLALAEMLMGEKKYSEAKKVVTPITTDTKYSGQASFLLAQLLEREGYVKEAVEYRARAIKALEAQKDYSRVGDLYVQSGNNAEALKNYLRAADKSDAVSMVKAADIYYLSGKHDKAKAYYKKALDSGVKDPRSLQWADYQYGKLAKDDEYLKKAKEGGGTVAEAADLMRTEK
jgi:tetratricopeptide (TPR) repeat protein